MGHIEKHNAAGHSCSVSGKDHTGTEEESWSWNEESGWVSRFRRERALIALVTRDMFGPDGDPQAVATRECILDPRFFERYVVSDVCQNNEYEPQEPSCQARHACHTNRS